MGLDMYLTKKIYIGANYNKTVKGSIDIEKNGKKLVIPLTEVSEICMSAGYWRKSNAIHKWFVDNVQDGVDDCKEYYVSNEKLEELRDKCKEVLEKRNKAEDILPSTAGFFFGGTDYDEYYFEDIESTISIIDNCLSSYNSDTDSFYYQSSW